MSTFEFGTTVKELPDQERLLAIARCVTSILIDDNPLFHARVVITHDAVFNGSGDLSWINFRVRVSDIEYPQARFVQQALGNLDLQTGITQSFPGNETAGLGMFTTAGADHLRAVLEGLEEDLRDGSLSPIKLRDEVAKRLEVIAAAGHGEVYDTEVRETIWDRLDRVLASLGIQLLDA